MIRPRASAVHVAQTDLQSNTGRRDPEKTAFDEGATRLLPAARTLACLLPLCLLGCSTRARTQSNELGIRAWLERYAEAQRMFRGSSKELYGIAGVFANVRDGRGFPDLWSVGDRQVAFMPPAFAQASRPNTAFRGYFFADITEGADGKLDPANEFALCAVPAEYGGTGIRTFIIDSGGVVFAKDTGGHPPSVLPAFAEEAWEPLPRLLVPEAPR